MLNKLRNSQPCKPTSIEIAPLNKEHKNQIDDREAVVRSHYYCEEYQLPILKDTSPMLLIFSGPLEELQIEAIGFREMSYNFKFEINFLGENIDTFANTPSPICL